MGIFNCGNMKKKIAILGSTGSIGKSLIDIIKRDKKSFEITLLTANKNYKELIKQAKLFKVKNLIITDNNSFILAKKNFSKKKLNNSFLRGRSSCLFAFIYPSRQKGLSSSYH